MEEIWKPIIGYENCYEVSSFGRIRSFEKEIPHGFYKGRTKILKARYKKFGKSNGYQNVTLSKNGIGKCFLVHRIVAINFIPNPKNKKTVNHINGNKKDNRVTNLQWHTSSEQAIHALETGLRIIKRCETTGRFLSERKRY